MAPQHPGQPNLTKALTCHRSAASDDAEAFRTSKHFTMPSSVETTKVEPVCGSQHTFSASPVS